MRRTLVALTLLLLSAIPLRAAIPHWNVNDIHPGMKGYGLTVLQGAEPERFDVEFVNSVDIDGLIFFLVRVSGGRNNFVRETGIAAGMSGSPIYVDDKLVGAIAFGWDFTSGGIGGVTPFEYMEREAEQAKSGNRSTFPRSLTVMHEGRSITLPEIPVLRSMSGESIRTLTFHTLASLPVRKAPAKKLPEMRMCAGCAISVALFSGDINLDATGTITAVDGNTVYAFGHPFLGKGAVQYAAWRTPIALTIPSVALSFKISGPDWSGQQAVINYDGNFGVYGTIGESPDTIPVEVSFDDRSGGKEELHLEVPNFEYTVLIVQFIAELAPSHYPDAANRSNLVFQGRIVPRGLREVYMNEVSPGQDPYIGLRHNESKQGNNPFSGVDRYLLALSDLFKESPDVKIERLQLRFAETRAAKSFVVERAFLKKPNVRRGGVLHVVLSVAEIGNLSGNRERYTTVVPIRIPRNIEPGSYHLFVESANNFKDRDENLDRLPDTLNELIARLNDSPRSDSLYLQAVVEEEQSSRKKIAKAKATKPDAVSDDDDSDSDGENTGTLWNMVRTPPNDRLRDKTIVIRSIVGLPASSPDAVVRVEGGSISISFSVLESFDPDPVTEKDPPSFWKKIFSRNK